jgi:hypothetical protein
MDEAIRVLRRLERIELLSRGTVQRQQLLGELRALVREAEVWARAEGDDRALSAVVKLQRGAEGMG